MDARASIAHRTIIDACAENVACFQMPVWKENVFFRLDEKAIVRPSARNCKRLLTLFGARRARTISIACCRQVWDTVRIASPITMRNVDGWQSLNERPSDQIIDLAA
jgi:hypothetical protein